MIPTVEEGKKGKKLYQADFRERSMELETAQGKFTRIQNNRIKQLAEYSSRLPHRRRHSKKYLHEYITLNQAVTGKKKQQRAYRRI